MTRMQLRGFYAPEQLTQVYAGRYLHDKWPDHRLRVAYTAQLLREMNPESVADLSCGDAAVVTQAKLACPVHLGDITPGWSYTGPVEETILEIPPVDVFVCSETLEHVENPDGLLQLIRGKARRLLLTTPDGESDSRNPEHYWGWTADDVKLMLADAGWEPEHFEHYTPPVPAPYYVFQVWGCR